MRAVAAFLATVAGVPIEIGDIAPAIMVEFAISSATRAAWPLLPASRCR